MVKINIELFQRFFHAMCIGATMAMTCYCFIKYWQDKDISLLRFVTFNDNESNIYPALSICFYNPFLNEKLKGYGHGINTTTYSQFLQGKYWDKRMMKIDYDNVTVALEDYLTEIGIQFANFSTRIWNSDLKPGKEFEKRPSFYVSNRNGKNKCFSFKTPYVSKVPIISFFTRMRSGIFPNGKRAAYPTFDGSKMDAGGFMAFLHYPGEHFRSYFDKKYSWKDRTNNTKNYDMIMTVKNMEVLKHRHKADTPCNMDWKNDDDIIMRKIVQTVGCKPPHWKISDLDVSPCSRKEQMKKFKWPTYETLQNFPPPCQVIEKLHYDYEEFDHKASSSDNNDQKSNTSWFGISLFFPETTYKEIKQVQAYDLEGFVGNTGGYIGLFLGYAILTLPMFIFSLYRAIIEKKEDWEPKIIDQRNENCKNNEQDSNSLMMHMPSPDNGHDIDKTISSMLKVIEAISKRQEKSERNVSEIQNVLSKKRQSETRIRGQTNQI